MAGEDGLDPGLALVWLQLVEGEIIAAGRRVDEREEALLTAATVHGGIAPIERAEIERGVFGHVPLRQLPEFPRIITREEDIVHRQPRP